MSSKTYPISGIPDQIPTGDGGAFAFDQPDAVQINRARMSHLDSLGLPIAGRTVLDVGCGIGHLAQFFLERGCKVHSIDGRTENIAELRTRYPALPASVVDVETESLDRLGVFDIVFCYGLLYHLENPLAGLRNIAPACRDLLLLETVITDSREPLIKFEEEASATWNQTLGRFGTRPSPSFVAMALNRIGFPYIYGAKTPPAHPNFQFEWKNNLDSSRDGQLLRCIFVGSRTELNNSELVLLLANPEIASHANARP